MPFNGNGTFTALSPPTYPAVANDVIYADRFNLVIQDILNGLSAVVTRDGQGTFTTPIDANGNKLKNLILGTAAAPSVSPLGGAGTGLWFPTIDSVALSTGGVERLKVDASGNVGISIANPQRKLEVAGYVRATDATNTNFRGFDIGYPGTTQTYGAFAMEITSGELRIQSGYTTWGGYQTFYTNGSERARLDTNGNLLIGTTGGLLSDGSRLRVTTNQGPTIDAQQTSGAATTVAALWNNAASGDNLLLALYTDAAAPYRGGIDYNRVGGVIRYNTSSDATLKNLIGDAPRAKSLAILDGVRLREYSWRDDPTNKPQIGPLAQELHTTYPGAVSVGGEYTELGEDEEPVTKYRPWAVDKTAFGYHLIAGYQHHRDKLAAQDAIIETLTAVIETLTARIEALETQA